LPPSRWIDKIDKEIKRRETKRGKNGMTKRILRQTRSTRRKIASDTQSGLFSRKKEARKNPSTIHLHSLENRMKENDPITKTTIVATCNLL